MSSPSAAVASESAAAASASASASPKEAAGPVIQFSVGAASALNQMLIQLTKTGALSDLDNMSVLLQFRKQLEAFLRQVNEANADAAANRS